jgi:cell wall-associated NlpC family hydrolase
LHHPDRRREETWHDAWRTAREVLKVRLWGRWWFGLAVAALAAAVTASTPEALGAGAQDHAAAQAVAVLVPGAEATGSAFVTSADAPAAGERYADSPAVRTGWAKAAAADAAGAAPSASASSLVRRARLLGGAVQVQKLWTSIALTADADGTVHELVRNDVHGLVVLGSPVGRTHGRPVALADWGTLTVTGTARTTAHGAVSTGAAGVRIELSKAHDGLAAGTVVELGTVSATVAPPAPQQQGSGSGSESSAPPPPPPPAKHHPAGHHRTPRHGSPPAHHQRRHPRPAPRLHLAHADHALIRAASGARARVIRAALDQVGWPYIWGGDDHSDGGFDCSGLVDYAYARAGMALPGRPTAAVLFSMSTAVGPHHLQPGDLAFLYSRRRAPYHVALYAGDGLVVVAPQAGAKVRVEPLAAVRWDGYGRLLAGGRGGGLARSVAEAARKLAHPSARRLAAARRADALAAARAALAARQAVRLSGAVRVDTAATAVHRPRIVELASVGRSAPETDASVAGAAVLALVAAACLVRLPGLRRRTGRD